MLKGGLQLPQAPNKRDLFYLRPPEANTTASADCVLRLFLLSWLVCQDLPSRSPLASLLHVSLVRPALASCPVPSLLLESVWPYSRSPWRRAEANGGNSDAASMTSMTTNATRSNIERRTGMSSESMPC